MQSNYYKFDYWMVRLGFVYLWILESEQEKKEKKLNFLSWFII